MRALDRHDLFRDTTKLVSTDETSHSSSSNRSTTHCGSKQLGWTRADAADVRATPAIRSLTTGTIQTMDVYDAV